MTKFCGRCKGDKGTELFGKKNVIDGVTKIRHRK